MRHLRLSGLGIALTLAALAGAWMAAGERRVLLQTASRPAAVTHAALLLRLGVNDTDATDWSGSVSISGGSLASLRSWRPHPEEEIKADSWKLKSRWTPAFQYRSWEDEPMTPSRRVLIPGALIIGCTGSAPALTIRTAQGEFTVRPAELSAASPRGYLNGRASVEIIPAAAELSAEPDNSEFPALANGHGGEMWIAWTAYRGGGNAVHVRRFDGKAWAEPQVLTAARSDVFGVKLGRDASGVWAVWAEQADGNWDLFGRRFDGRNWAARVRLTSEPLPDIYPALATDSKGRLWLAWQGFRGGKSDIFVRSFDGGRWSDPVKLSESPANDWQPTLAADGAGRVHAAWDTYDKGNYDVMLRTFDGNAWGPVSAIASTTKFEAHVTLACDRRDRLWAAWSESGLQWGKDTGLLVRRPATPLYKNRLMAVAVRDGGAWKEPAADVERSLPEELRDRNESLTLASDGAGRMWLFFRHRFDRVPDVPICAALHGATWEAFATAYDGHRWTTPIPLPFSQGRSDMPTAVAADAQGNLLAAWSTDDRDYDAMIHKHARIHAGSLPAIAATPVEFAFKPRVEPNLRPFPAHPREAEDVARIRGFKLTSSGRTYKILRGDIHRHTEISRDGKNDGSLWDTYRYALDAAALDFLGVSDHNTQGGPDLEYINWLNQQAADVFHVVSSFVPLFGYERSLNFPNGHRNVMFARRGPPAFAIPPEEQKGKTGAKGLYEYLKRYRGIAVSHTSATNMGTDWRDNDPDVEPLVEIYQGDRTSAEHEGAPKAPSKGDVTSHAGGYRPEGYVWNAWAKGYKLGVQASSDHLSTHVSYACTIATDFTREGLLDAMRARHSYAATDNIILDFRIVNGAREFIQGDIAEARGDFRLAVKVIGTAPIRQIDIIRSNTYLHTRQNLAQETSFTFTDNQPLAGESYYYVRVQQVDEQMAWSSPIWIRR